MSNIVVRGANDWDVERLAPRMRKADVEELEVIYGKEPEEALRISILGAQRAWAGTVSGIVMCCFGVGHGSDENVGIPWLLAAEGIEKYQMPFLKRCRTYVHEMSQLYPVLVNYVTPQNVSAIRWLKWLGFKVEEPAPLWADGPVAQAFTMVRSCASS
jgi:ribosomal protein S18 acetylase RimI-like enzyme